VIFVDGYEGFYDGVNTFADMTADLSVERLAEIHQRKLKEIEPMMADDVVTLEEKLEEIDRLSQELFREHRLFTPLYPWVFVLVCKKTQQVGHIILPDKQNKTVWEGIVLATWGQKIFERGIVNKDGVRQTRCEIVRSEFGPGQRVVFPHWAGQPVPGFNEERFRVVREHGDDKTQGVIYGWIDVQPGMTKPVQDLLQLVAQAHTGEPWPALDPKEARLLEENVEDRFVVVDRETNSVTLSGR